MSGIYQSYIDFLKYNVTVSYNDGSTVTNPALIYRKPLKIKLEVIDENGLLDDVIFGAIFNNNSRVIQKEIDVRQIHPFSSDLHAEGSIETGFFTPTPGKISLSVWSFKKKYFHAEIPVEEPPSDSSDTSEDENKSTDSEETTTTVEQKKDKKTYIYYTLIGAALITFLYLVKRRW